MRLSRGTCSALLLTLVTACVDVPNPTSPPPPKEPIPGPTPIGVYQIEVTGIGTDGMSSSISAPGPALGANPVLTVAGAGIVFEQVASSSFTEGGRTSGGQRYVSFTYRVRNGTGVSLNNLTVLLVSRSGTIAGTALSTLRRFDGAAANPAIASQVVPTGAVNTCVARGCYTAALPARCVTCPVPSSSSSTTIPKR